MKTLTRIHLGLLACFVVRSLDPSAEAQVKNAQKGHELFIVRCSGCHSTDGRTKVGPPLFHILKSGRLTTGQVRNIVKNGRDSMPPFRRKLNEEELDDLIEYLKSL